jgi:single-stranded-DNA-specific exonuclease
VADVAPIVGENRAIARIGLQRIRTAPTPGLAAVIVGAGVAHDAVDLETVAYVIAPRLNAAGRVGDAIEAAQLLLTDDPARAVELAERLQAANTIRRDLTRTAIADAQAVLAAQPGDPAATVVRGDWPVGVIGLVAGRLAEERGRPAVVGTELDGVIRASCRSAAGFDLAAALADCADLFVRHGGHPGAAGFELPRERWETFRDRFLALAANGLPASSDGRPELRVDLVVPAPEVDYGFLAELHRLDPTGPGNPDPLVAVEGLTVTRVRAANGGHTQLTLRKRLDVVDGIAFGRADLADAVGEGDRLDVVARVVTRRFGGYESIQLEIRDVASEGHAARSAGTAASDRQPLAAGMVP